MPCVTEDNLTDVALEHWKDIPDPRLRQIMESFDQASPRLRARQRADAGGIRHGDRLAGCSTDRAIQQFLRLANGLLVEDSSLP